MWDPENAGRPYFHGIKQLKSVGEVFKTIVTGLVRALENISVEFLLPLGLLGLHALPFVIVVCNKENLKQSSDFDVKRTVLAIPHVPVLAHA